MEDAALLGFSSVSPAPDATDTGMAGLGEVGSGGWAGGGGAAPGGGGGGGGGGDE